MGLGCMRFNVVNSGNQVPGDKHTQEERAKGREEDRLVNGGRRGRKERREERRGGGRKGKREDSDSGCLRPLKHLVQNLPF